MNLDDVAKPDVFFLDRLRQLLKIFGGRPFTYTMTETIQGYNYCETVTVMGHEPPSSPQNA